MNIASTQLVSVSGFADAQATGAGAGGGAHAHAEDIARFRQTFADAKPPGADQAAPAAPVSQDVSPGVRSILGQFDSLNGNAAALTKMADAMRASGGELKPSQIIDMTLRCHELVFQAELTSNVANRSSEGVQQLFRQQS